MYFRYLLQSAFQINAPVVPIGILPQPFICHKEIVQYHQMCTTSLSTLLKSLRHEIPSPQNFAYSSPPFTFQSKKLPGLFSPSRNTKVNGSNHATEKVGLY